MDLLVLLTLIAMAGAFSLWCPCGYSIAETVTHTVSGWRRFRVRALLLGATTFSAALFGFVIGLIALPFNLEPVSAEVLAIAGVVALVADELARRWKAFKPLAVGRQVPREWGIIFPAETVSVLYGLRLGIAPLTILASWIWWVAIIAGAFSGPWISALVGVTFGVSRIVVSELSTARTTTNTMATRMNKVRMVERPLRVVGAVALVVALGVGIAGTDVVDQPREERVAQP